MCPFVENYLMNEFFKLRMFSSVTTVTSKSYHYHTLDINGTRLSVCLCVENLCNSCGGWWKIVYDVNINIYLVRKFNDSHLELIMSGWKRKMWMNCECWTGSQTDLEEDNTAMQAGYCNIIRRLWLYEVKLSVGYKFINKGIMY